MEIEMSMIYVPWSAAYVVAFAFLRLLRNLLLSYHLKKLGDILFNFVINESYSASVRIT